MRPGEGLRLCASKSLGFQVRIVTRLREMLTNPQLYVAKLSWELRKNNLGVYCEWN